MEDSDLEIDEKIKRQHSKSKIITNLNSKNKKIFALNDLRKKVIKGD